MSQKRSYKQYPPEFKEEAVALVTEQGYSVPEAAKSLGIATNLLVGGVEDQVVIHWLLLCCFIHCRAEQLNDIMLEPKVSESTQGTEQQKPQR